MNKNKHIVFSDICKKQGWKCTAQRLAMYEFVCDNYSHPSVDDAWGFIKKTLPTITRESVYRILNEFADVGIIQRLDQLSCARYDSQTQSHAHFICAMCGKITDIAMPKNMPMPQMLEVGDTKHMELRITGICSQCKTTNILDTNNLQKG